MVRFGEFELVQALFILGFYALIFGFAIFLFRASGSLTYQIFQSGLIILILCAILFLHYWLRERFGIDFDKNETSLKDSKNS